MYNFFVEYRLNIPIDKLKIQYFLSLDQPVIKLPKNSQANMTML